MTRKQSSPRLSTLAAKVIAVMARVSVPDAYLLTFTSPNAVKPSQVSKCVSAADLRSLCASVLSQGEQPGQSPPAVRKRVRRARGRRGGPSRG